MPVVATQSVGTTPVSHTGVLTWSPGQDPRPGRAPATRRPGPRPRRERRGQLGPVHRASTEDFTAAHLGRLTRQLAAPGWAGPRADRHPAPRRGPGSEPAQDPRQGAGAAGRQPRTRTPEEVRVKGSRW